MVWTASLTNFSNGDTPTHTQLNAYLDNIAWLHNPPTNSYAETNDGSNFTTTATTWADINSNFSLSLTTTGGLVFILFAATISNLDLDISIGGTRRGETGTSGNGISTYRTPSTIHGVVIPLIVSLAANTYTIAAQWRVPSAGTGTIWTQYAPRFYVREL